MTSLRLLIPKNPPPAPKLLSPFLAAGTWIWRGSRIFWRPSSTVLMPWMITVNIFSNDDWQITHLLDPVVLLHVLSVLPRLLVEEHQPLPVHCVRVEIFLAHQGEVGVTEILIRSSAINIKSGSYKSKFWHLSLLKYFWQFIDSLWLIMSLRTDSNFRSVSLVL